MQSKMGHLVTKNFKKLNKILINNFDLIYNGMYFIEWKGCRIRVYLELNVILKMIEIEGLNYKKIHQKNHHKEPIHFDMVVWKVMGIESSVKRTLKTNDMAGHYFEKKGFILFDMGYKTIDGFI